MNGKTEYWGNSYGYDAWGNLLAKTVIKCSAENMSVTAAPNNQLQGGYLYDAPGNMTHDVTANLNYSYDRENRITGANGFTYTYDADGNRVAKVTPSPPQTPTSGTLYWYMSPGIVAESDLSGKLQSEYVFFDGERVARRDNPGTTSSSVSYYLSDHLKTTDIVTDAQGNIKNESDFYPWGGELQFLANDLNHYKFTGKERDSETGLDYFGARYYSNGLARFITPDWAAKATAVPYAEFADPQSLNLYSYVRNIPTTKVDKDGHCPDGCVIESVVVGVIFVGVATSIYISQPDNARSIANALSGAASKISSWIHPDNSGKVAPSPPPSTPTTVNTQTPPSTPTTGVSTQNSGTTSNAGAVPATSVTTNTGTIYVVPGSATKSGKPYVGRHNRPNPAQTRKSNDGRDRTQAQVIDTYDATNTQAGRVAEQQQIDQHGGVDNLDNKRNEIAPKKP